MKMLMITAEDAAATAAAATVAPTASVFSRAATTCTETAPYNHASVNLDSAIREKAIQEPMKVIGSNSIVGHNPVSTKVAVRNGNNYPFLESIHDATKALVTADDISSTQECMQCQAAACQPEDSNNIPLYISQKLSPRATTVLPPANNDDLKDTVITVGSRPYQWVDDKLP